MAAHIARVIQKEALSPDVTHFKLGLLDGELTNLEPGAHVDVTIGEGIVRQYSIWDWGPSGRWISIAVKCEESGRGGSMAMQALDIGSQLTISGPRNLFKLQGSDGHKLLIAGGIGVTPIIAMARKLRDIGANFNVVYLVRSQEHAAMDKYFQALGLGNRYILNCGNTDGRFDLDGLIKSQQGAGEIYACGPESMVDSVLEAGKMHSNRSIHFERFAIASGESLKPNSSFEIEIESTGVVFAVGVDESILDVLQGNDIHVDFGCSEGLCGSCIVDVSKGEVDHRDGILSPEDHETNAFMCVCVSRARSERLVLKL